MSRFKAGTGVLIVALALVLGVGGPAFAQGSIFSRLSGTVVDTEGAAMPGVNVTVKNLGTGQVKELYNARVIGRERGRHLASRDGLERPVEREVEVHRTRGMPNRAGDGARGDRAQVAQRGPRDGGRRDLEELAHERDGGTDGHAHGEHGDEDGPEPGERPGEQAEHPQSDGDERERGQRA